MKAGQSYSNRILHHQRFAVAVFRHIGHAMGNRGVCCSPELFRRRPLIPPSFPVLGNRKMAFPTSWIPESLRPQKAQESHPYEARRKHVEIFPRHTKSLGLKNNLLTL